MTIRPGQPCPPCPWLVANHGKPHPDGWYTKRNRDRLWVGLRRGERMSCHPTDPSNPVSDKATAAGYRPAPEHAAVRECVGALVLQQRELQILSDLGGHLPLYRSRRPKGLLRAGVTRLVQRLLFGGLPNTEPGMPKPNLNAPVGHDPLPWTTRTTDDG